MCRIAALPPTVKHLVVCATVPIVFPKLPLSELTLTALEDLHFIKGALQKTGLAAGIVDKCAPSLFSNSFSEHLHEG